MPPTLPVAQPCTCVSRLTSEALQEVVLGGSGLAVSGDGPVYAIALAIGLKHVGLGQPLQAVLRHLQGPTGVGSLQDPTARDVQVATHI